MNVRLSLCSLFFIVTAPLIHAAYGPANAIFMTTAEGNLEEVQRIVAKDPNSVEQLDENGFTPLHYASYNGNDTIVRFLLEKEASVNRQDINGKTPLHHAAEQANGSKRYDLIISMLIKAGASVNIKDKTDNTPLHYAASHRNCNEATVRLLLENNASVHAKNQMGLTPLHKAARMGNKAIIILLIEHNARIFTTDKYKRTPRVAALEMGYIEAADVLQKWECYEKARLAFCGALHPGLGEHSPAYNLPEWIVQDILGRLHPSDFIETH